jgi:FAD:protein FMN transferase
VIASASFAALGTTAAVYVADPARLSAARELLASELAAIDLACSRFRPDSELSLVNAAHGLRVRVSELFCEALEAGLRAARLTEGAVEVTLGRALRAIGYDRDFAALADREVAVAPIRAASVGGWRSVELDRGLRTVRVPVGVEIDLGATAKALAADRAAGRIHGALGGGVLVNLGGDVSIAGPPPPAGWLVRVTDDHACPAALEGQTVIVSDGGLATSSTSVRRWATRAGARHHILDPTTGDSAAEVWRTASVAAGSCVDANIAATAAIVRGEAAPAWLAARRLPSRLVRPGGDVVRLAGWPEESSP